jgi:hypothetical protein
MAVLAGELEAKRSDCAPVAGKSTLSRLEYAPEEGPTNAPARYHKISHDGSAIEGLLVDVFLEAHAEAPPAIVLDLDATDSPLHGHQEGRFFHGFYDSYCNLPLLIFCGHHLLAAKLRRASIDVAAGAKQEVERIVAQIRTRWPETMIILRADSGFCRDELMDWAEHNDVHFVTGVARNERLVAEAERLSKETGHPARVFKDFQWTTLES